MSLSKLIIWLFENHAGFIVIKHTAFMNLEFTYYKRPLKSILYKYDTIGRGCFQLRTMV